MNVRFRVMPLVALLAFTGTAAAETLLVDRVQQEPTTAMPSRGMSMDQVQARFGAPASKLEPRGGQKHQWPTINRWSYPAFTVYFEKSKVVDAVANKTGDDEVGPKPAVR
jgi:hypothetical protein